MFTLNGGINVRSPYVYTLFPFFFLRILWVRWATDLSVLLSYLTFFFTTGDSTNLFKSSSSGRLLNNCWSTICISRTEYPLKPGLWLLHSLFERVTPWSSSLIQHSAPWPSNKMSQERKESLCLTYLITTVCEYNHTHSLWKPRKR